MAMQVQASIYAQNAKLSIKMENVSVKQIIKEIKKNSEFSFVYSDVDINGLDKRDVNFTNVAVEKILNKCLQGTDIVYEIVDRIIILKKVSDKEFPVMQKAITVKGIVKDKDGNPLPGVSVIIKGTNSGVSTDNNGKFKIDIPEKGMTLLFSFIGMKTKEYKVEDNKDLNVILEEDKKQLDEVVITGYANINKESFTGNSVSVSKEELLKVSKTSIISALQAFDPSFRIEENNEMGSNPNALPEMYIRGRSGIGVKELDANNFSRVAMKSNPNLPTFILDGFEVSIEKVFDYDINRIENITILKDAAATAMYGSRAANGVVVITSIAPKSGELHVTYGITGSVIAPDLSDYNLMNAAQKIEAERLAGLFDPAESQTESEGLKKYNEKLAQLRKGVDTYWLSKPLRTVLNHKHSLFIEGGEKNIRFGLDVQYDSNDGIMKESYRNRKGVGFFIDYKINNLQIRNYVSYNNMSSQNSPYGSFSDYTDKLPYNEFKDEDGNYLQELKLWQSGNSKVNPLYEAHLNSHDKSSYKEFIDNLGINWYVNDYLQVKGQFSITYQNDNSDIFIDPRSKRGGNDSRDMHLKGSLSLSNGESTRYYGNVFTSYNRNIGVHNMNLNVGAEISSQESNEVRQLFWGFPSGALNSMNYARELVDKPSKYDNTTRSIGFISTLNYTINNIYLFDASCRVDGSSEFGANKRFAPFWSGGFGINLHKYEFIKNMSFIDMLKLRSSYGQTGKVNFPAYCAISMYQVEADDSYKHGYGVHLMALGNVDLVWEKTNTIDVGFETTMFKNRFTLKASYYNKRTEDLITDVTVPASAGFSSYKDNLGEIENKGYELNLNLNLVRSRDLFISVYGNMAHNENKILKISDALKAYNDKVNDQYFDEGETYTDIKYTRPLRKYEEGGSTTSIFAMRSLGIDPITGQELYINRDGSVSYEWNAHQQSIVGNTEPDFMGSFGLNAQYKSFSLFASFMYEYGGQRYNSTLVSKVENADIYINNVDKRILTDRWRNVGDFTTLKNIADNRMTRPTERFVQDYNYISLGSLSLGYDFDKKIANRMGMSLFRIEFSSNDMFRISTVKAERGLSYPFSRTVNFSVKAQF